MKKPSGRRMHKRYGFLRFSFILFSLYLLDTLGRVNVSFRILGKLISILNDSELCPLHTGTSFLLTWKLADSRMLLELAEEEPSSTLSRFSCPYS
jgi:hypothetical protein